jgi:peptidoglycan/LPS O-acetylase OafA/YrhL
LVLGALTTSLPASSYYSNWGTWSYLGRCLALITFDGTLPGVFVDNPYPSAVNGSLWTLPLEVTAYLILAGLGIAGALRRAPTVVMCAAMAASTLVLQGSMLEAVTNLFAYFLAGAALYLWRDRIWLSWPVAIALVALWIASFGSAVVVLTGVAALPYATLVASYRTPVTLRWFTGLGDVSYGMYIYVMWLIPSAGPLLNIAISLPITWVLALASWRWVEQPALRLKPRSSRSAPIANAPVPDTASRSCPETLRSNPANS